MIQINDALLQEIGLGSLPQEERRGLLNHIYETLELRVGMRLADQMTNEQLDEFEKYFEARDDKGAFNWLETNFPNYKEIVQQEFDKLKGEVAQSAPQILSTSQSATAAQPQVPQASQPPQQPYNPQAQVPDPNLPQSGQSSQVSPTPPIPPTQPPAGLPPTYQS
ncbi:MAG TPA: DUF5663 domain-containing protein [Candidatus Saccharimonadales bacterium]|jgi:hypothetical protein